MQEFSLLEMWEAMGWPVKTNTIFMVIMSIWSIYVIVEPEGEAKEPFVEVTEVNKHDY